VIVVRLVPIAIVAGVVLLFKTTHVIYVLVVKIVIIVKRVTNDHKVDDLPSHPQIPVF